jgi:ABC-type transporter lipoprotein component MlaA/pimeloyl-ACP methyl ester carboxylesterase
MLVGCSTVSPPLPNAASSKVSTFPDFIADPIEPVNRGVWAINEGVMLGVLRPSGRVYRNVLPMEVRRSVRDFGRNITYPGRLVNHVLQGRWNGAGDESLRFVCNSTVGVAGLFDVASKWGIPKSNADFGQTFSHWGWKPNTFVMLPFLGPSDDSHAVGFAADRFAEPLNYVSQYAYISAAVTANGIAESTEIASQFILSESDSYVGTKYIWSYAAKEEPPMWESNGPKDIPTLQTMNVALIRCQDPKFIERTREMAVRLPSTGRNMKFNYWLQPNAAPLVYVAPGLGTHRLSMPTLSVAEALYLDGYSVVTTTGLFHPEFMENASTSALPAYPPNDCRDLLIELTAFDQALEKKFQGRFGRRALVGFSMGGFQSMYLAAREKHEQAGLLRFDRYVAIDLPVDIRHGAGVIDDLSASSVAAWPAAERQSVINNAIHKAAKLATLPPSAGGLPPFDANESKFLVGLSFRVTLRDTIYDSQRRSNMGVLQTPITPWRRDESYRELSDYSLRDYFLRFVVPYNKTRGIGLDDFAREVTLESYGRQLRAQSKARVIVNRNDFLLRPRDVSWLQATMGPSRIKVFADGGHLGNLSSAPFQKAICDSLSGLK